MTETTLRQMLVECGIKLLDNNLVQGTWGNTSMRLDNEYMLVSPSGLAYDTMKTEDIAKVKLATLEWTGPLKPTSEKAIHAGMYLMDNKINAVIHTHPTYCSVLAASRIALPVINEKMQKLVGGEARLAKYALPSTGTLANNTLLAMKDRKACLMANHGVLTVGETMDEAFEIIQLMEQCAKQYLMDSYAKLYNEPYTLEGLIAKFSK